MTWFVDVRKSDFHSGCDVHIGRDLGREESSFEVVTDLTFEKHEAYAPLGKPAIRGRDSVTFLQAMMDAAWDAGLRPSRAQDEKHLQAHLNDMRSIAFHTLKMDPKGGSK